MYTSPLFHFAKYCKYAVRGETHKSIDFYVLSFIFKMSPERNRYLHFNRIMDMNFLTTETYIRSIRNERIKATLVFRFRIITSKLVILKLSTAHSLLLTLLCARALVPAPVGNENMTDVKHIRSFLFPVLVHNFS